jgi:hypothetical protein
LVMHATAASATRDASEREAVIDAVKACVRNLVHLSAP